MPSDSLLASPRGRELWQEASTREEKAASIPASFLRGHLHLAESLHRRSFHGAHSAHCSALPGSGGRFLLKSLQLKDGDQLGCYQPWFTAVSLAILLPPLLCK